MKKGKRIIRSKKEKRSLISMARSTRSKAEERSRRTKRAYF